MENLPELQLTDEQIEAENDLLDDFLKTLEARGLNKPKVKTGQKKAGQPVATPRVSLPDPVPVKILQEYCTFQCIDCRTSHRFLMKTLVGFRVGTGTHFRQVSELTSRMEALLEEGAVLTEERHVEVQNCPVCRSFV